jgi:hypothetical protein
LGAEDAPIVGAGDWWHPKWWRADVNGQAITLKNMEQVQALGQTANILNIVNKMK